MPITLGEVEQIARLARLALAPDEVSAIARDLDSILGHVRELERVDTSGVAPMRGVGDQPAPMREDLAGHDPLQLDLQKIAPAMEGRFFLVPRLAALDADALADAGSSA
jgi:aspartyl-tRNA(Asn)/glutamyl-tRNA(Gln) amidotransferase subunit C